MYCSQKQAHRYSTTHLTLTIVIVITHNLRSRTYSESARTSISLVTSSMPGHPARPTCSSKSASSVLRTWRVPSAPSRASPHITGWPSCTKSAPSASALNLYVSDRTVNIDPRKKKRRRRRRRERGGGGRGGRTCRLHCGCQSRSRLLGCCP